MDDALLALERALRMNPDDKSLAFAYYRALRRNGKEIKALSKKRFEFECSKRWHQLDRTTNDYVRYCGSCDRDVYFATNEDELNAYAEAGHCVSILVNKLTPMFDQVSQLPQSKSLPMADPPCLVMAEWPDLVYEAVDLDSSGYFGMVAGQVKSPSSSNMPDFVKELIDQRTPPKEVEPRLSPRFSGSFWFRPSRWDRFQHLINSAYRLAGSRYNRARVSERPKRMPAPKPNRTRKLLKAIGLRLSKLFS